MTEATEQTTLTAATVAQMVNAAVATAIRDLKAELNVPALRSELANLKSTLDTIVTDVRKFLDQAASSPQAQSVETTLLMRLAHIEGWLENLNIGAHAAFSAFKQSEADAPKFEPPAR